MSRKSKLGCNTCRNRKVKCDETLPICRRCIKSRLRCDGPFKNKFILDGSHGTSEPSCRSVTPSPFLLRGSLPAGLDATESRSFAFFLHQVAPNLGGEIDVDFWTILLPQICHENSSICYAILSTSRLSESTALQNSSPSRRENSSDYLARQWYAQSLSSFRSTIELPAPEPRHDLLLLSCILFMNIEFQQNNTHNACNLLSNGLHMIRALSPPRYDTTLSVLIRILERQRPLLALHGFYQHETHREPPVTTPSMGEFPSVEIFNVARQELFLCVNDTAHLIRVVYVAEARNQMIESFHTRQQLLLEKIGNWHHNFHYLLNSRTTHSNTISKLLTMYYEVTKALASACLGPETDNDAHVATFAKTIDLAEEMIQQRHQSVSSTPSYSFELGTILPLFLVGWKCRDPQLRRKALQLLYKCPAREALYSADIHARALRMVIQVEEDNTCAFRIQTQNDCVRWPPEHCRIRGVTVQYETDPGQKVTPSLIYNLSRYGTTFDFMQSTVPI